MCAFPLILLMAVGAPQAGEAPPAPPRMPTLFLVGDSTVKTTGPALKGWGDAIVELFDASRVRVENHAVPGRSTRSFRDEGRWRKVLESARAGDFVLIQMGHYDSKPLDDPKYARCGTLPGTGEATLEVVDPVTRRREVVHSYGWYLRRYIDDARAHGLTPILLSPVPRLGELPGDDGEADPSPYSAWAAEVAESEGVAFIDLNRIVTDRYLGLTLRQLRARYFTPADGSHTSPEGARLNAECVIEGLRALGECPLKDALKPQSPAEAP